MFPTQPYKFKLKQKHTQLKSEICIFNLLISNKKIVKKILKSMKNKNKKEITKKEDFLES